MSEPTRATGPQGPAPTPMIVPTDAVVADVQAYQRFVGDARPPRCGYLFLPMSLACGVALFAPSFGAYGSVVDLVIRSTIAAAGLLMLTLFVLLTIRLPRTVPTALALLLLLLCATMAFWLVTAIPLFLFSRDTWTLRSTLAPFWSVPPVFAVAIYVAWCMKTIGTSLHEGFARSRGTNPQVHSPAPLPVPSLPARLQYERRATVIVDLPVWLRWYCRGVAALLIVLGLTSVAKGTQIADPSIGRTIVVIGVVTALVGGLFVQQSRSLARRTRPALGIACRIGALITAMFVLGGVLQLLEIWLIRGSTQVVGPGDFWISAGMLVLSALCLVAFIALDRVFRRFNEAFVAEEVRLVRQP